MISRKVQNREIFHLNFIDVLVALGGVLSLPLLKLFLIKLVYDLQRGQAREGTVFVVVSRVFLALRNVMRTHKLAEQSVTPLNSWQAPDCVGHKLLFNLRYQEVGQPAAAKFKVLLSFTSCSLFASRPRIPESYAGRDGVSLT